MRWRRSTSSHRPATPGLTSGLPGVGEGLSARRIIIIEWIGSVGRRVYAAWRTISAISVLARVYTAVQAGIRRSARPRLGRTEDDADPRMGTARRSEDISSSDGGSLQDFDAIAGHQRGGRVSSIANAKPMPPAINSAPSGLSCTFCARAAEPSRNVSPLLS